MRNQETVKGYLPALILSLLKRRPMYGYQLIKELAAQSNGVFALPQGTVYPTLYRLKAQGLVKSQRLVGESGKERNTYTLTTEGQKALERSLEDWKTFSKGMNLCLDL